MISRFIETGFNLNRKLVIKLFEKKVWQLKNHGPFQGDSTHCNPLPGW